MRAKGITNAKVILSRATPGGGSRSLELRIMRVIGYTAAQAAISGLKTINLKSHPVCL